MWLGFVVINFSYYYKTTIEWHTLTSDFFILKANPAKRLSIFFSAKNFKCYLFCPVQFHYDVFLCTAYGLHTIAIPWRLTDFMMPEWIQIPKCLFYTTASSSISVVVLGIKKLAIREMLWLGHRRFNVVTWSQATVTHLEVVHGCCSDKYTGVVCPVSCKLQNLSIKLFSGSLLEPLAQDPCVFPPQHFAIPGLSSEPCKP